MSDWEEVKRLRQELKNAYEGRDKANAEHKKAEHKKIERLERKNAILEDCVEARREDITSLISQMERLKKNEFNHSADRRQCEELNKRLGEANAGLDVARKDIGNLTDEVVRLNHCVLNSQRERDELQFKLVELRRERDKLSNRLNAEVEGINNSTIHYNGTARELEIANSKCEELRSELETERKQLAIRDKQTEDEVHARMAAQDEVKEARERIVFLNRRMVRYTDGTFYTELTAEIEGLNEKLDREEKLRKNAVAGRDSSKLVNEKLREESVVIIKYNNEVNGKLAMLRGVLEGWDIHGDDKARAVIRDILAPKPAFDAVVALTDAREQHIQDLDREAYLARVKEIIQEQGNQHTEQICGEPYLKYGSSATCKLPKGHSGLHDIR